MDLLKQFEENEAQAIATGKLLIFPGSGHFLDQPLAAQFRQVVTEGAEFVLVYGIAQGFGNGEVNLLGREAVSSGEVAEAHQGLHDGKLPRVVQFQAGDSFPG